MEIISFKTVPVLFEMERDGVKPFTVREADPRDERFQSLFSGEAKVIELVNTETGEKFQRRIRGCRNVPEANGWIVILWKP